MRSKSSTSSLKVGRSIGLYCQHSRIKRYLHSKENANESSLFLNDGTALLILEAFRLEGHDLHFKRTTDGLLHPVAVPEELEQSLDVGHRRVRGATQRHDFPQQDSKGPDVRLARVDALEQGFGRHPFHGQAAVSRLAVVLVHVNVSCQSKVGNLQDKVVRDEHVAGRQISVNALQCYEETPKMNPH